MSTDDKDLLKLAAKAAGLTIWHGPDGTQLIENGVATVHWNPLTNDGDALRLAVKVGMETYHADDDGMFVYASHPSARGIAYAIEPHGADPCAATRRAIVRAAAEIGRQHD